MLMDLRILRAFVEVVRQGGFSQAAKTLYTTQSNVSKSVKLLEEEVNCSLLDRAGHRNTLTEAGKIVFDRAQSMLAQREDLVAELEELRGLKRGTLRLGLPPIGSDVLFAPVFAIYQQRYPSVKVQLTEHGGRHLQELLQAGEIDVAGTLLPVGDPALAWKEIQREPIDVLISADHPLAKRKTIKLAELADVAFLLFEEGFALNQVVLDACNKSGFTPTIAARSNQLAFVVELVAVGLGVAFLPRMIARQRKHAGVRHIPISDSDMEWRMALLWRSSSHLSFAAQAWVDLFNGVKQR
jgi:DNA-binding transcriptional LysR family regulator